MPSPYVSNYGIVQATASTLTVTAAAHAGKTIVLDRAAGVTVTLPDATGSGNFYKFIVKTTVTSNGYIIQVPDADNTMDGHIKLHQDSADTIASFDAAATSDTVTLNGTTTGGLVGAVLTFTDYGTDLWHVVGESAATGTEATPFSASVS